MTPTVTTLAKLQPLATPAQPNNAGVAGGQIHSQLWPTAGSAATTAQLNALNSNSYAVASPAVDPGGNGGSRPALSSDGGLGKLADGMNRIYDPESVGSFLHGFSEVGGGFAEAPPEVPGSLLQGAGNWLHELGDAEPIAKPIVAPFGDALIGAGSGLSDPARGIGDSFNDFGSAVESATHGDLKGVAENLGRSLLDPAKGVASAVGDGVKSVGNAIKDTFSWL
jgi:hypothetical protein